MTTTSASSSGSPTGTNAPSSPSRGSSDKAEPPPRLPGNQPTPSCAGTPPTGASIHDAGYERIGLQGIRFVAGPLEPRRVQDHRGGDQPHRVPNHVPNHVPDRAKVEVRP